MKKTIVFLTSIFFSATLAFAQEKSLPKINVKNTEVIEWDFEKQNTLNKEVDILIHLAAEKKNKNKMSVAITRTPISLFSSIIA